jgi:hypothetical protein
MRIDAAAYACSSGVLLLMKTIDADERLRVLLADSKRFQPLTEEDLKLYGAPKLLLLEPPSTEDRLAQEKRRKWIDWRAAPYPAQRHAEYLFKINEDVAGGAPRILISAVLDISGGIEAYMAQFDKKKRYQVTGRKAENLGYTATKITPREQARNIHTIIASTASRQGRPVAEPYASRPVDYDFPDYLDFQDPHYKDICVGVFHPDGDLAAYLLGKRVGDHVQYDEIMGHDEHLHNDVMFLLHTFFLYQCAAQEIIPR